MPELPEVETIVRGLRDDLCQKKIKKVIVSEKKLIGHPQKETFIKQITAQNIINVTRRGKYIIIELENEKLLVIHLRMTGKLLLKESNEEIQKHTHIIFKLENKLDLRFNNIRKFGRVYLVDKNEQEQAGSLTSLGPEPLSDDFSLEDFKELFNGRHSLLKPLLLRQNFIAGLGNIYTDEALFQAGLHPERKSNTLNDDELEKLYWAIKDILQQGIKYNGTSFSDYVNTQGEMGEFQQRLKVYQKDGTECPQCGTIIEKKKVGGRGTHMCPQCQI